MPSDGRVMTVGMLLVGTVTGSPVDTTRVEHCLFNAERLAMDLKRSGAAGPFSGLL
jgi:hypothetical protein